MKAAKAKAAEIDAPMARNSKNMFWGAGWVKELRRFSDTSALRAATCVSAADGGFDSSLPYVVENVDELTKIYENPRVKASFATFKGMLPKSSQAQQRIKAQSTAHPNMSKLVYTPLVQCCPSKVPFDKDPDVYIWGNQQDCMAIRICKPSRVANEDKHTAH